MHRTVFQEQGQMASRLVFRKASWPDLNRQNAPAPHLAMELRHGSNGQNAAALPVKAMQGTRLSLRVHGRQDFCVQSVCRRLEKREYFCSEAQSNQQEISELRAYVEAAILFSSDLGVTRERLGVGLESGTEETPAKSTLHPAAIFTSASECA
jgi:hypothetical protein